MGGPERGLVVRLGGQDLLDDEAFPRGADLGVTQERLLGAQPEELVQEAAVAHVDLGRLDLTLGEVGVPRLELTDHQGVGQQIEWRATYETSGDRPRSSDSRSAAPRSFSICSKRS
jgi:hypothetical protein